MTTFPQAPQCQHILNTGRRCKGPAVKGTDFCHWHDKSRNTTDKSPLPLLEDGNSVQLALTMVLRGIQSGQYSPKQGTSMLYGLSIASYNLKKVHVDYEFHAYVEPANAESVCASPVQPPPVLHQPAQPPVPISAETEASKVTNDRPQPAALLASLQPDLLDELLNPPPKKPSQSVPALPPESFASPESLAPTNTFTLREERFRPEEVRAYWTQHLTPEAANLRHNAELVYEPPTWLPLTDEELEYLRTHVAPLFEPPTEEQEKNQERMTFHFTHLNVHPPTTADIHRDVASLLKSDELFARLFPSLAK
jgi:hypothetical protein